MSKDKLVKIFEESLDKKRLYVKVAMAIFAAVKKMSWSYLRLKKNQILGCKRHGWRYFLLQKMWISIFWFAKDVNGYILDE